LFFKPFLDAGLVKEVFYVTRKDNYQVLREDFLTADRAHRILIDRINTEASLKLDLFPILFES